jgi:NTP pyrophosphatase (non-canonical NTP hydrolase)
MALLDSELEAEILAFREARDWKQFHSPRNLSASIAIEAAELLECFQWARDSDLDALVDRERTSIEDEVADVVILLSYFCVDLKIDINEVVRRKLAKNEEKYPSHLARGRSDKYNKL